MVFPKALARRATWLSPSASLNTDPGSTDGGPTPLSPASSRRSFSSTTSSDLASRSTSSPVRRSSRFGRRRITIVATTSGEGDDEDSYVVAKSLPEQQLQPSLQQSSSSSSLTTTKNKSSKFGMPRRRSSPSLVPTLDKEQQEEQPEENVFCMSPGMEGQKIRIVSPANTASTATISSAASSSFDSSDPHFRGSASSPHHHHHSVSPQRRRFRPKTPTFSRNKNAAVTPPVSPSAVAHARANTPTPPPPPPPATTTTTTTTTASSNSAKRPPTPPPIVGSGNNNTTTTTTSNNNNNNNNNAGNSSNPSRSVRSAIAAAAQAASRNFSSGSKKKSGQVPNSNNSRRSGRATPPPSPHKQSPPSGDFHVVIYPNQTDDSPEPTAAKSHAGAGSTATNSMGVWDDASKSPYPSWSAADSWVTTMDSASNTMVAGNLYFSPASLLLSSIVALSVLRLVEMDRNFLPSTTRTVRESLHRHLQFHLNRTNQAHHQQQHTHHQSAAAYQYNNHASLNTSSSSPVGDFVGSEATSPSRTSKTRRNGKPYQTGLDTTASSSFETSSWLGSSSWANLSVNTPYRENNFYTETNMIATDCLRDGNVDAAIAVFLAALEKQRQHRTDQDSQSGIGISGTTGSWTSSLNTQGHNRVVVSFSQAAAHFLDVAQQADTHSKLAMLCLYAGRLTEALQHANQSFHLLQGNDRPLPLAMATMQVGLVHFATQRTSRALKSWREATTAFTNAVGYDHPIVAILFNNIGVLHYETGDALAAQRALEESLTLQKQLLKSGPHVDTDYSLHQLANTMGNLSMVFELQGDYSQSLALLQEAESLYDSVTDPAAASTRTVLEPHVDRLHRLHADHNRRGRHTPEGSLLETESLEDSAGSSCLPDEISLSDMIIPPTKANPTIRFQQSDLNDYLLLGQVAREWTPRERVRETVLASFGLPASWRQKKEMNSGTEGFTSAFWRNTLGTGLLPFGGGGGSGNEQSDLIAFQRPTTPLHLPSGQEHGEFEQLNEQIMEFILKDEVEQAIGILHNALSEYRDSHNMEAVGTTLHNIGMLHLLNEEYLRAYAVFQEACTIRTKLLGEQHHLVASSKMKLGLLQYSALDMTAAARTLSDIRSTYLSSVGYGHPHLAQIMNNLGVLRYEEGDLKASHRAFEIAYEYQRRVLEEDYHNEADSGRNKEYAGIALAYTLMNMGILYHRTDDLLGALRLLEEAKLALTPHLSTSDRVFQILQQNIECLIGKGVEMNHCDETCRMSKLTPSVPSCTLSTLLWRR